MEAAVQRSEMLEEENELLREEIARIRVQASALKEGAAASAEAHAIADKALDVLDQLEAVSKRPNKVRVALEGKLSGEMRPLDAVVPEVEAPRSRNDIVIAAKPVARVAAKEPPANKSYAVFWVGAVMFALGIVLGHCVS
jgi:hypothetical protein